MVVGPEGLFLKETVTLAFVTKAAYVAINKHYDITHSPSDSSLNKGRWLGNCLGKTLFQMPAEAVFQM